jgi:hypothetical protein
MPLKKVNKVIIEPYHFIVGDTFFSVENPNSVTYPDDSVVISREDAIELVRWMVSELMPDQYQADNKKYTKIRDEKFPIPVEAVDYDPGDRRAAQTEPSFALRPGESAEVVDLGAIKGGIPKGKVVREGVEVHVPQSTP